MLNAEAAHGDRVLLQSTAELIDGDDNATSDLYVYDANKPAGSRLTLISQGNVPGRDAEAQALFTASEDLHRIYFLAGKQILAGEPSGSGPKLYLWEDEDGKPSLSYVATLSSQDGTFPHISPDGRYMAFLSKLRETAYDNAGQSEIYRYDATTGQLVCVSCDPGGQPARTSPGFNTLSIVPSPLHETRNVSSRGQVFFQTPEGLVPRDSNGQMDVYEYEDGAPHLLSTGVGPTESLFMDAGRSGNDVFFATADPLVKWDLDQNFDAYDARVNGGLPEPSQGIFGCQGDACQSPPNPPNDETPGSASFEGPGNLVAPLSKSVVKSKTKPLTRAQKLARAMKTCKRIKSKKRRSACEKKAKKLYGRSK